MQGRKKIFKRSAQQSSGRKNFTDSLAGLRKIFERRLS